MRRAVVFADSRSLVPNAAADCARGVEDLGPGGRIIRDRLPQSLADGVAHERILMRAGEDRTGDGVIPELHPHRSRATLSFAVGVHLHGVLAERESVDDAGQRACALHEREPVALVHAVDPHLDLLRRYRLRHADVQARVAARDLVGRGGYDADLERYAGGRTGLGVIRRVCGLPCRKQCNEREKL
jgi:hypothetical protein